MKMILVITNTEGWLRMKEQYRKELGDEEFKNHAKTHSLWSHEARDGS